MIYIVFSVLAIIIGLIGIFRNKLPKYRDGPGFAAEVKFYLMFYGLLIIGVFSLIIKIKSYF